MCGRRKAFAIPPFGFLLTLRHPKTGSHRQPFAWPPYSRQPGFPREYSYSQILDCWALSFCCGSSCRLGVLGEVQTTSSGASLLSSLYPCSQQSLRRRISRWGGTCRRNAEDIRFTGCDSAASTFSKKLSLLWMTLLGSTFRANGFLLSGFRAKGLSASTRSE